MLSPKPWRSMTSWNGGGSHRFQVELMRPYLGGGLKYLLFSSLFGGRFPIWLIFFRWVETTNQICFLNEKAGCSKQCCPIRHPKSSKYLWVEGMTRLPRQHTRSSKTRKKNRRYVFGCLGFGFRYLEGTTTMMIHTFPPIAPSFNFKMGVSPIGNRY